MARFRARTSTRRAGKIGIPEDLTKEEESAVNDLLGMYRFNRFHVWIDSDNKIKPYFSVKLVNTRSGESLLSECLNTIEKRFSIEDIEAKIISERTNVDLTVIEPIDLEKGFLTFVLTDDLQTFAQRFQALDQYGDSLANREPHTPHKSELCLVLKPDPDGIWYRAQYQVDLMDARAQVRLIDFGITTVVAISDIRKFEEQFAYSQLSFIGKIRSDCSLELLNYGHFDNFDTVNASIIRPAGNGFEVYLDRRYFFENENFEEDLLIAELLQQQLQQQQFLQLQQHQQQNQ